MPVFRGGEATDKAFGMASVSCLSLLFHSSSRTQYEKGTSKQHVFSRHLSLTPRLFAALQRMREASADLLFSLSSNVLLQHEEDTPFGSAAAAVAAAAVAAAAIQREDVGERCQRAPRS